MDQPHSDRRRYDMEIHAVQTDIQWLKDAVARMERSMAENGKRQPLAPIMAMLIAGFAVTVTLGVQALSGQNALFEASLSRVTEALDSHERIGSLHKQRFAAHIADGHSPAVRQLLTRVEAELRELVGIVDASHDLADEEQEQDISELREQDALTERRDDTQDARLTRLETWSEEAEKRGAMALAHRDQLREAASADRWTGGQQSVYRRGHEQQHRIERRLMAQPAQ